MADPDARALQDRFGQYAAVHLDVLPIELRRYENYQKVFFDSFNKALDEYFSKHVVAEEMRMGVSSA